VADTQILPGGQGAAPQDWTLPASAELIVKAVSASFDGSAAAVSWYPAVELISDAGDRIALAITSSARAAGESAVVSFFPGGGLGAGAAAASGGLAWCFGYASVNVPSGFGYVNYGLSAGTFYTNDSSTFSLVSSGGNLIPEISAAGIYLMHLGVDMPMVAAPAAGSNGNVSTSGAFYPISSDGQDDFWLEPGFATYHSRPFQVSLINLDAGGSPPPQSYPIQIAQNSGNAANGSTLSCWIIQQNPTGDPNF
jgi:hypothetical protein